jgi:hypothetical protein
MEQTVSLLVVPVVRVVPVRVVPVAAVVLIGADAAVSAVVQVAMRVTAVPVPVPVVQHIAVADVIL